MANEIRRRYNFLSGTIDDNPLSNSATTLNSTELAGLPAVSSSEYAVLVLDPTGAGNGPEVVYVTAHTGSATSATIVRGREGTSGVSHASTITWVHVATAADFPLVASGSSDRPSTGGLPYEGQMIYQQDTKELLAYTTSTTGWQKPWSMPWGILGIASVTSNASISGSSSVTDISGLSVTFTAVANRRVRLTARGRILSGGSSDQASLYIRESSTTLDQTLKFHGSVIGETHTCETIITPTTGSHTYKVSAAQSNASAGTFQAAATYPAFICAEDIGPSANPA